MIVQDLFKLVDKEGMFLTFVRRHDIIAVDDYRRNVKQEIDLYKKLKTKVYDFIEKMATCTIRKNNDYEIFVIEMSACDFENPKKNKFEVFSIDKELLKNDTNLDDLIYCSFALDDPEAVAGYDVSQKSIDEYGIEAVCSEILNELKLFEFGATKETKMAFMQDVVCCTSENDKWKQIEEYMNKKMLKNLNEDKRKCLEAYEEYKTKVKPFEDKWIEDKKVKNEKITRKFLMKELCDC